MVPALDPHTAVRAAEVGPCRALPRGPARPALQGHAQKAPTPTRDRMNAARRMGSHAGQCTASPRVSTPASVQQPRTTSMSCYFCGRPSKRRGGKTEASGTSSQAQPQTPAPPLDPANLNAQTSATPAPSQPTAPFRPQMPHKTKRRVPEPAKPPPESKMCTGWTEPRPHTSHSGIYCCCLPSKPDLLPTPTTPDYQRLATPHKQ